MSEPSGEFQPTAPPFASKQFALDLRGPSLCWQSEHHRTRSQTILTENANACPRLHAVFLSCNEEDVAQINAMEQSGEWQLGLYSTEDHGTRDVTWLRSQNS